jgi:RES domain-containing protein
MILWRIASETRQYGAADLSGAGAAAKPGRWNAIGEAVLYAAPTIAMAVLETAAHIDDAGLPQNRFVVRIDVPEKMWRARITLGVDALPVTWTAIPAGRASVGVGSRWIREGASVLLEVPSVIVPEETVVALNATHPEIERLKATVVRRFDYPRLFRGG